MLRRRYGVAQFLRFCLVGIGNTSVDFTAFYALTLAGVSPLPAQVLSYSAGVANSFFMNRKWTFRVTRNTNVSEVAKFLLVNGLSLLVSYGLLFLLNDAYHLPLWPSKLAATVGAIIVNFIGSRVWVFAETQAVRSDIH